MHDGRAIVQQAIFTSARTARSAGYHVVASSPGVAEIDRRELAAWGPSHDSLVGSESVNFFPLPSGAYCLSRSTLAGWEYSGRGGQRVHTQCLIVQPNLLRQFGNHPLRLLAAATAQGALETRDPVPPSLDPIELQDVLEFTNPESLPEAVREIGPARMATLVEAALGRACIAVLGTVSPTRLVHALLDCLPADCRTALHFSTGLKFSSRRPFDLIAMPDDPAQQRWLSHQPGVSPLDLRPEPAAQFLANDWARFVCRALSAGDFAFLAEELARPRPDLTAADLPALGLQLIEEYEADAMHRAQPRSLTQAHAAHPRFEKTIAATRQDASVACAPSALLGADSPEVVARLESLDDVVFDAVQGKGEAMSQLHALWPALKAELGDVLLDESREQYIRYALSVWREPPNIDGTCDPLRAVRALEVLCVLFDTIA